MKAYPSRTGAAYHEVEDLEGPARCGLVPAHGWRVPVLAIDPGRTPRYRKPTGTLTLTPCNRCYSEKVEPTVVCSVLDVIDTYGPMSLQQVANELVLKPGSLERMLYRADRADLVYRLKPGTRSRAQISAVASSRALRKRVLRGRAAEAGISPDMPGGLGSGGTGPTPPPRPITTLTSRRRAVNLDETDATSSAG